MSDGLLVDPLALREEVKTKYRAVAVNPHGSYHFHTGRPLARRLGYDEAAVAALPDSAVEAFAGVGNPFSVGVLKPGERVVDLGSGGGFDCFVASGQIGLEGCVVWHRHDRGNAWTLTSRGDGDGPAQCRISARRDRGLADRRWLGRCRHQQRCHQSMRRQAPGLRRSHARLETRWALAVCGYRERQGNPGGGAAQYRLVD